MRLIQPYRDHRSSSPVPDEARADCSVPVYHVRYRYPHHAEPSGYDRLCDYVGETIELSCGLYWLGETLLRPRALAAAKYGGNVEYSRHDYVMEREAMRHFRAHRDSIYHYVYGEKQYRFMGRWAGRNGNKIVLTVHQPPEKVPGHVGDLEHFRRVDHVVALSKNQVSLWSGLVGEGAVTHIPYAVDTSYFCPGDSSRSLEPSRCLFVGAHERDFINLPELVDLVLASNLDAEFCMVSSDSCCEALAHEHERAVWRPRVTDAEYLELLQTSDLLVLPLVRSTTCTAVLEAMACGVPVVTTQGGIEDYLTDDVGQCAAVGDMKAMAALVTEILKNEVRREGMAEAAVCRAAEFSWPAIARRMAALYEEIMRA